MRVRFALTVAVLVAVGIPTRADATPALAREYNIPCSVCHSAVPYLSPVGRAVKEGGYRLPDDDGSFDPEMQPNRTWNDALTLEEALPLTARFQGAILAKEREEDERLDPIAVASLVSVGNWADEGSQFLSIGTSVANEPSTSITAQLGYHPAREFNVLVGTAGSFHPDPYNTFSHSVTWFEKRAAGRVVGGHGVNPTLMGYGRAGSLYYAAAWMAGAGNESGATPRAGSMRLAWDFGTSASLGAFCTYADVHGGETEEDSHALTIRPSPLAGHDEGSGGDGPERHEIRAGGDLSFEVGDLHGNALFAAVTDEVDEESTTDFAAHVELLYLWRKKGRPLLVPVLRAEYLTTGDGEDRTVNVVAGVQHFLRENARFGIEANADAIVPDGQDNNWAATLTLDVVF